MPYLFRTPPGFNLHVRGPINRPKVGAMALEGLVETDWTCASFTMNWMMLEPNKEVVFRAGEPIALLAPVRRADLERFRPMIVPMANRPDVQDRFEIFSQSRDAFNRELSLGDELAQDDAWQRHYFQGRDPDGTEGRDHQTKLKLDPFVMVPPRPSTGR